MVATCVLNALTLRDLKRPVRKLIAAAVIEGMNQKRWRRVAKVLSTIIYADGPKGGILCYRCAADGLLPGLLTESFSMTKL